MSSTPQIETDAEVIRSVAAELLNGEVAALERIGGGRNSRVFRVETPQSRSFAMKLYYRHDTDARDRLGTEFGAFRFLWQRGLRQVPQPIAADPKRGCAIYEFVEGERFSGNQVAARDIDEAADLICALKALRAHPESQKFGPASEASFSINGIVENVRQRRRRLCGAQTTPDALSALNSFLAGEFAPAFEKIQQWSLSRLQPAQIRNDQEIPMSERTLSPSDFGFHNALRRRGGQIVFLDFEYFGWDDPAKLVSDFLLHPAMEISTELKRRFAMCVLDNFAENCQLLPRIEAVYPLFGLKWCLILLNEFLPADLQRREFAQRAELDREDVQMKQLEKARRMLGRLQDEYERFPYFE